MILNPSVHEQIQLARSRLQVIQQYLAEQQGPIKASKMQEFEAEATQHYRLLIDRGLATRAELDDYLTDIRGE